jgi:hypothetical protein
LNRSLFLASCLALTGCGIDTYRPRSLVEMDPVYEVDDADIAKAFEASPQMPAEFTVAYYSTGERQRSLDEESGEPRAGVTNDGALKDLLGGLPGVLDVYRIPDLLASTTQPARYGEAPTLSIKKLRLAAARAHCEILVIFDHGRTEGSVNGLMAFAPLLVPVLFLPFADTRVHSYLSAYVIDVRNGYFYGQVDADALGGTEYQMIYSASERDDQAKEQWATMAQDTREKLRVLFEHEQASRAEQPTASTASR